MLTINSPLKNDTVYAFDFDNTLVKMKSNSKFPADENDWMPLYPNTKSMLQKCFAEGKTIVIFTNQRGVEKGKISKQTVEKRLRNFIEYVGIPITAFAAIAYDNHRKPHTKMWTEMCKLTTFKNALFVGDAAGRLKDKNNKKDFSCSDRKFAFNIGIPFQTPEEFFLSQDERKWEWGGFDSEIFMQNFKPRNAEILPANEKEMILLIGPQASGKSTLSLKFPNYVRINQDSLGTKAKCIKLTKESIKVGRSIVVDNTNADIDNRKIYVNLAREAKYKVRFININVDKEMAMHLDEMRVELTGCKPIPAIAFNIFFKKLREHPPSLQECDLLLQYFWEPREAGGSFLMKF